MRGFTIFPDRNPGDYKVILVIHEPQLGPRSLKHAPSGFGTGSFGSSSEEFTIYDFSCLVACEDLRFFQVAILVITKLFS